MEAEAACQRLRAAGFTPCCWGMILGTGLSGHGAGCVVERGLPASQLPGFARTRVAGHPGRVEMRCYGGVPVLTFAGRTHLYEGLGVAPVLASVRLAAAWGVARLLVVSAVGAVSPAALAHPFVFLSDYLVATPDAETASMLDGGVRHPVFDPALTAQWRLVADSLGLAHCTGVYAFCRGPQYETAAEIAVLSQWGADVVGMSMVPEATAARSLGISVVGLAVVTNAATGLSEKAHDHADVQQASFRQAPQLARLIAAALERGG